MCRLDCLDVCALSATTRRARSPAKSGSCGQHLRCQGLVRTQDLAGNERFWVEDGGAGPGVQERYRGREERCQVLDGICKGAPIRSFALGRDLHEPPLPLPLPLPWSGGRLALNDLERGVISHQRRIKSPRGDEGEERLQCLAIFEPDEVEVAAPRRGPVSGRTGEGVNRSQAGEGRTGSERVQCVVCGLCIGESRRRVGEGVAEARDRRLYAREERCCSIEAEGQNARERRTAGARAI